MFANMHKKREPFVDNLLNPKALVNRDTNKHETAHAQRREPPASLILVS